MVCPKCGVEIDENSEACYSCGLEFKHAEVPQIEEVNDEKCKNKNSPKKIKLKPVKVLIIAIISIAVLILAVLIFKAIFVQKGDKIAAKLGEMVGENIVQAVNNADVKLSEKSKSDAINSQLNFDYIYEDGKMIKVDGVKVPKWTIKIQMKDSDVFSVCYRNYQEQKKYYKGEKLKKPIKRSEIIDGETTKKEVEDLLRISPLSITYYEGSTEYCYMYYYINKDKDEERDKIVVKFDNDDIVKSVEMTDFSKTCNPIL